jgi:hypothetical protein
MKTFKTDSPVRLMQPAVEGVVVAGKLAESGDAIDYRVVITLPGGEHHVREFPADQLELLEGDDATRVHARHDEHIQAQAKNILADAEAAVFHLTKERAEERDPAKQEKLDSDLESAKARLVSVKGGAT